MDDEEQRALGRRLLEELAAEGVEAVLVGSTAVVALRLFPRTSKDADALAPPSLTLDQARDVMRRVGSRHALTPTEAGENTLSLVAGDPAAPAWRMDLIVPAGGLIPERAARLIHRMAVETDVGRAAIPEHILVMKAVAYGDCVGKGRPRRALEYESDVARLRDIDHAWREDLVRELLETFPDARRGPAARLIRRTFRWSMPEPFDPNI